jgi:hypothetical protein
MSEILSADCLETGRDYVVAKTEEIGGTALILRDGVENPEHRRHKNSIRQQGEGVYRS